MADTADDKIGEIKKQTELLTEQTKLLTEQAKLDAAKGASYFAELEAIKKGLSSVIPAGKDGTISVSKGTDGALLLRLKAEMLKFLDKSAQHILDQLPANYKFVIASGTDLESAYKSMLVLEQLKQQTAKIEEAVKKAPLPDGLVFLPTTFAGVSFALNALSDAAKFFRVDKTFSVFDANEEARRLLQLFVEARANTVEPSLVIGISDLPSDEILKEGRALLASLDNLKTAYDLAADRLEKIQKLREELPKIPTGQPKPELPKDTAIEVLKGEIGITKTLLDSLNPTTNASTFWSQVTGQIKSKHIENRSRIEINVSAQIVQVLEKRTWREDKLIGAGDVQMDYRITDPSGKYLVSGLKLYTSGTQNVFDERSSEEIAIP